jgi:macrocin-O-methyltransferase TylF-like protien
MTGRDRDFSMQDPRTQTPADLEVAQRLEDYFPASLGQHVDKLRNFTKYVTRQSLAHFLARHELFRKVVEQHGHIIECGVFLGGGLMTWAQLSAIYEPFNHTRRVVGFDTFKGFPGLHAKDSAPAPEYAVTGGLATHARSDIEQGIAIYDRNRPIGHVPRVELVEGDATQTIPEFARSNPHLVVALLYLDFDLYEPTRAALETFVPRMPKGSILGFDELDQAAWPGETLAVLETLGLRNLRIRRFPFTPQLSYAVLE